MLTKKMCIILFVLIGLAIVSSCNSPRNTSIPYETFHSYQLFYGEWVITELVAERERRYSEEQEDVIGRVVLYNSRSFISGSLPEKSPIYNIILLPVTDIPYQTYGRSPKELGLHGEYFAIVTVSIDEPSPKYLGSRFYIVDDMTLLCIDGDYTYKMERISYIDDYQEMYTRP